MQKRGGPATFSRTGGCRAIKERGKRERFGEAAEGSDGAGSSQAWVAREKEMGLGVRSKGGRRG